MKRISFMLLSVAVFNSCTTTPPIVEPKPILSTELPQHVFVEEKDEEIENQDEQKVIEESIKNPDTTALYTQGLNFLNQKKFIQAYQRFRQSSEFGHIEAQFELAQLYHQGKGVPLDQIKAHYWYHKAAKQGHVKASLATQIKKEPTIIRKSEPTIVKKSEPEKSDCADLQFEQAHSYYEGKGVPKDREKAAIWYHKAASQGHIKAQFTLAGLYHFGIGVPQNITQAIEWYQKAAEQNYANAQLSLGMIYFNKLYRPRDLAKSKKWLSQAAEQGNENAKTILKQVNMMLQ